MAEAINSPARAGSSSMQPRITPPEIHERPGLPPEQAAVQKRAIEYVRSNFAALVHGYSEDPRNHASQGALILAADAVKPMLPGFQTNAEAAVNSVAVHEPSKAVTDYLQGQEYAKPITDGRDTIQLITGTPGSGKTVSSQEGKVARHIAVVKESIFTSAAKTIRQVQEIIDSGHRAEVAWLYLYDPATNLERAAPRAEKIGRTVPISYMSDAYPAHAVAIQTLLQRFGDVMPVIAFDNSGKGPIAVPLRRALDTVASYSATRSKELMHDRLDELVRTGRISDTTAQGLRYEEPPPSSELRGEGTTRAGYNRSDHGDRIQETRQRRQPLLDPSPASPGVTRAPRALTGIGIEPLPESA